MDLRQLRYFCVIAEKRSISAASQVLNVAQPALSSHMRNMENHLGIKLLTRSARGVSPTEAGEFLLRRARVVLDEITRIEDDIRNLGAAPVGDVRLGLPGTIGGILSVPLVLAVKARFPGIRLTIGDAMSGFVLGWLREGRIDIAVLYIPAPDKQFNSELLLSEELVLLAPNGLVINQPLKPRDLVQLPLILPSPAHGLRNLLDGWARGNGINLCAKVELDSYANIKTLVEQGYGCSVLPLHAVVESANAGLLQLVRFVENVPRRNVFLVRDISRPASYASDAIMKLIHEIIVELVNAETWSGAALLHRS